MTASADTTGQTQEPRAQNWLTTLGLPWSELTATQAYSVLRLRSQIFVVEQGCVFLDADGADLHPETEHYFHADNHGVSSYLRLLPRGYADGPASSEEGRSIGRVTTRPDARGQGLSGQLLEAAIDRHGDQLLTLNAQERLESWYARYGFQASGPVFIEDDIRHVPMRRPGR
ncbi:GNAT family N-acetyltransferase [Saxibacter everestensis]|uniref:GNAT family N-acetyltransferase n=1 Tax=Saxibacter everestensis TaxID=2909229 RepID=A0ABY8QYA6_9MICO|nr:GNAT family N-acetyltransferase [Brevibacteriaceae bacterium ZFBP1038]